MSNINISDNIIMDEFMNGLASRITDDANLSSDKTDLLLQVNRGKNAKRTNTIKYR